MKNRNWTEWIEPLLLMILGIILIVNPDSAAALVAKILAWVLILVGTGMGIAALHGDTARRVRRLIPAVIALALGIWLMANPLFLAESLGRFLGILLAIQGMGDVISAVKGERSLNVISVVTLAAAVFLIMVPMTTSRILITICGIVVLCIGVAELSDKLLRKKLPPKEEKPGVIDAEP